MLVQVVMLRHEGRKLTAEEVRSAPVHTGRIRVAREPGGKLGSWARAASLDVGQEQLVSLHHVQLTRWDARGIVLVGVEQHWSRRRSETNPQSWWCRLVSEAPGPGSDLLDEEEEREHLSEGHYQRHGRIFCLDSAAVSPWSRFNVGAIVDPRFAKAIKGVLRRRGA